MKERRIIVGGQSMHPAKVFSWFYKVCIHVLFYNICLHDLFCLHFDWLDFPQNNIILVLFTLQLINHYTERIYI